MDSNDQPEPNVPALPVRTTLAQSASPDASLLGVSASDALGSVNIVGMTWRALTRHWWKLLAAWAVVSTGLIYLIAIKIKPTFESYSVLRVEPARLDLYGVGLHASEGFGQFLQTQVELVRSPNVLDAALRKSEVYALSIVRSAEDPEAELQRLLQVGIVPGTYLIKVSITSPTPAEASVIIKAVVEAYLKTADEWTDGMSSKQLKSLESYQDELQRQVLEKQNEWLALASKGNIELVNDEGSGQSSGLPRPSNERITLDEYKRVREQLFQVSLELVETEALLNARRAELKLDASKSDPALRLQRRVREAFKADPEVAQVYQQIEKLQRRHEEIMRLARLRSDPAIAHAERQLRALVARHRQLWDAKYEELVARFQEETDPSDPASGPRELAERVEMLKIRRTNFEKILSQLKLTNTQEGTDAVKVALVREDLSSLKGMVEAVGRRIEQLKFEARGEARISKIDETRPGGIFVGDNRKKYWAMTPVGVMGVLVGFFVLLEARAGRVADVDELSRRVPVDVYAVPSLPDRRPTSDSRSLRNHENRLQEFLESLDHLRVSLWCGPEAASESGRCLLITSATGGEGKTTLSAQLAVCCAKAGISTLLVDADLRRAALSRMFEEDQTQGLSDVLRGDVPAEEAVVAVRDGGFHLLPAGTGGHPPGWLLRDQRIGQVLARYRQIFDIVIIDSSPVLPVPDALSLGRWTDGAILVVRYDMSRFPLVDRARKRIVATGIPILKTVVNGVRSSRFSAYKSWDYDSNGYVYSGRGPRPSESAPT